MCKMLGLIALFIFYVMGLGVSSATKIMNPRQFVQDLIQNEKVVIFSKTHCPYCTMAKETFKKLNVVPKNVELDHLSNASEIQDVLGEITGARTVPRVFVNGKFIGGGSDVKALHEKGELKVLISQ